MLSLQGRGIEALNWSPVSISVIMRQANFTHSQLLKLAWHGQLLDEVESQQNVCPPSSVQQSHFSVICDNLELQVICEQSCFCLRSRIAKKCSKKCSHALLGALQRHSQRPTRKGHQVGKDLLIATVVSNRSRPTLSVQNKTLN